MPATMATALRDESAVAPEPIRPQTGPQEDFLRVSTRIAVYGGAAGGGKTFDAALYPLYHVDHPLFQSVTFRRIRPSIFAPFSLHDTCMQVYPMLNAAYNKNEMAWRFPSGAKVRYGHLQYDKDVLAWKSASIPLIQFDELTEISKYQFFYMFSRNRSTIGVRPYIRAYTNPDPFSWVKDLLAPWVHENWPAEDRAHPGEVRWFFHKDNVIQWVPKGTPKAISITFIPARLEDNQKLQEVNPDYEASLEALPEEEKRMLRYGDWTMYAQGKMFKIEYFPHFFDVLPGDIENIVRGWDTAATATKNGNQPGGKTNDPDYTASVKIARRRAGAFPRYLIVEATWQQLDPGDVESHIQAITAQDGRRVRVRIEQEPGSAGKRDIFHFTTRVLDGFDVVGRPSSQNKVLRARAFAAQCRAHNVGLLRGAWNTGFLNYLFAFPSPLVHDDVVDAASGAFDELHLGGDIEPLDADTAQALRSYRGY